MPSMGAIQISDLEAICFICELRDLLEPSMGAIQIGNLEAISFICELKDLLVRRS